MSPNRHALKAEDGYASLALEQRIRKQNTKLILIKKNLNYFRRSINRTEDKNRDSFLFILKFNNKGQAIGFLMDS